MGTIVACHISHTILVQIGELHTPLFRISIGLVGFHPHDLDRPERSQGPDFQGPYRACAVPLVAFSSPQSMKASHTFAKANKPPRLALIKSPDGHGSQNLRTINRLLY
eukprot:4766330-Amphidinium_carterae.1